MSSLSATMYRYLTILTIAACSVAFCGQAQAQVQDPDLTLYVDGDGNPQVEDGEMWDTAFRFLQDGIASALQAIGDPNQDITTVWIWVASTDLANPYRPDRSATDPDGTRDRHATFQLNNGIHLYGGFLGLDHPTEPEDDLADANPEVNTTVLTGAQPAQAYAVCGDSEAGNCFGDNGTPGCNDAECCAMVCAALPLCCTAAWDGACASLAGDVCGVCGQPGSGDCFSGNGTPGCQGRFVLRRRLRAESVLLSEPVGSGAVRGHRGRHLPRRRLPRRAR